MSWLEDRIAERNQRLARSAEIDENAPAVYDDLWTHIAEIVKEAKQKKLGVLTNGSSYDRVIRLTVESGEPGTLTPAKGVHVRLNRDIHTISATGSGVNVTFRLSICDHGFVCLMHGDKQVTPAHAAILILDPLLFPDLPPTTEPNPPEPKPSE